MESSHSPQGPFCALLNYPRLTAAVVTVGLHWLALLFLADTSRPNFASPVGEDVSVQVIWVSRPAQVEKDPPALPPTPPMAVLQKKLPHTNPVASLPSSEQIEDADIPTTAAAPPELVDGAKPLASPSVSCLGLQGLSPLAVSILLSPNGDIETVSLTQSSGSAQCDDAALQHVRTHWKFEAHGVSMLRTFPVEVVDEP
jgi:TonB family protein